MLRIGDKTEEKKISETKKKNIDKGTRIGTPTKAKRQGRLLLRPHTRKISISHKEQKHTDWLLVIYTYVNHPTQATFNFQGR